MRTPLCLSRAVLAGVTAALAVAGLLAPAPVTAAEPAAAAAAAAAAPVVSLRAALVATTGHARDLPRGRTRRGPVRAALRSLQAPAPVPAPVLTAPRVARIDLVFVDTPDNAWSTQAQAAFRAAADVWERSIESSVPIEVVATARNLGPGVLGGAGPYDFLRNEGTTVTPEGGTLTAAEARDDVFEPVALRNARTGFDATPPEPGQRNPDIEAEFNPNARGLYLGTDGRPAANQIDFRTVALHEIAHGLGITGMATVDGARATVGFPDVNGDTGVRSGVSFDQFTYATTAAQAGTGGTPLLSLPDGSSALRAALTGGQLYWSGQTALTAAGGKVRLHAPSSCGEQLRPRACTAGESPFVDGSSYTHLDERSHPRGSAQALMTPYLDAGESHAGPGQVALGMLADLGYAVPTLTGSRFTAVDPVRLLDTRTGRGAPRGAVGPGRSLDLQVAGAAGVPARATAVVLNVTGVAATAQTDVRAYPTPVTYSPVPGVSSLNLTRGATRANLVTVPVGNLGRVRLRNSTGSVHLLADLAGWYAPGGAASFRAVDPVRVLDTRRAGGSAALGPGGTLDLPVAGTAGVPPGATAVALTVTAVDASGAVDVRAYPGGGAPSDVPGASSLNASSSAPVPNLVVARLGPDGTVRLRSGGGTTHLLADLAGYYAVDGGALFRTVTPRRVLDTRIGLGAPAAALRGLGPGAVATLSAGRGTTIPRAASAAVLNVTGVRATARTDLRVYPATAPVVPQVSHLNLEPGSTSADLVIAKLGGGAVRLRNSAGRVGLVVDAAGWFGPP